MSPSGNSVALGYFQFVFDNDTVTVKQAEPVRGADVNVTNYASIVLQDIHFNEAERNWYITAQLKNISPFTGYDVWIVFHSMGNKFVTNQDGFMWALPPIFPQPTRLPFIAYGKDQPGRVFPPLFADTRTIIIHQPEGVPKLAPIGFWVDATMQQRHTPGVENLHIAEPNPGEFNLTAYVWDHQSPSSDLVVIADMGGIGGGNAVPMFDDGQHGDGEAGDDYFGAGFGGADLHDGPITIYAFDPQGNQGENDIWFSPNPCNEEPYNIPFETIEKGENSGIFDQENHVIFNPNMWVEIWTQHKSIFDPPPPPPVINFEDNIVIGIWGGERTTNGHHVTITHIQFDPCDHSLVVFYKYTPHNAGCGPLDVITHPFHIVEIPKPAEFHVYFEGEEVPCDEQPPDCVENVQFDTYIQGTHSGIHDSYEFLIHGPDAFEQLWTQHTKDMNPPPPPPPINFEQFDLVAVGIGDRPNSGFGVQINKICYLGNQKLGVFYTEMIPGKNCDTLPVITQPHHWVLIPKMNLVPMWFPKEEVYNCPPGGCEPVEWMHKGDGMKSCVEGGNYIIHNGDQLNDYWHQIYCDNPDTPPPPPFFPPEETIFLIQTQGFPTGGFWVSVDEVCIDHEQKYVEVNWTLHIPGENCVVPQIPTRPWIMAAAPLPAEAQYEWNFVGHEEVYPCPGDCNPVDWDVKADGPKSCEPPGMFPIPGPDALFDVWNGIHCNNPDAPPPPEIGWQFEAPFLIQLHGYPTTGYYITIDDACIDFSAKRVEVNWTLNIPGVNCEVLQVETHPWLLGTVFVANGVDQIDGFDWDFIGNEHVYECPPGDCMPMPFLNPANGDWSCGEKGAWGYQGFGELFLDKWYQVNCYEPGSGDPPPPVPDHPEPQNGEWKPFIIQAHEQLTGGYWISIDEVCLEGCNVRVDYTLHIPGPDCPTADVLTRPWALGYVDLPPIECDVTYEFVGHEEVYNCPGDCYDFETLAGGQHGGTEQFGTWLITNEDQLHQYWTTYHPNQEIPAINFDGGWGAYAIHLGERHTSGYEVEINSFCIEGDFTEFVQVDWTEWIPGPTCPVEQVMTYPWTFATMELVDLPYDDFGHEEVYKCD